ncbi:MAG TPA: zf-HC2 domain-containing protein [Longimicrobiales bacterium]|nr:zf-HC2 domain-containing protein [Longimicrobiales bacterium]
MPHIDEGTLHALLDGALRALEPEQADAAEAHIDGCAECQARLEEAASLRGRTDEILRVLEPDASPDFEEVLIRAGAAGAAGAATGDRRGLARQLRWTRGLAWAATIVIALGTGYLIRDQVVPGAGGGGGAEGAATREGSAPQVAVSEEGPEPRQDPGSDGTSPSQADALVLEESDVPVRVDQRAAEAPGAVRDGEVRAREVMASTREAGAQTSRIQLRASSASVREMAVAPDEVSRLAGAPLMVLPGAEVATVVVSEDSGQPVIVSLQRLGEGPAIRVTQRPAAIALDEVVVTGVVAEGADGAAPPAAPGAREPLGEPVPPSDDSGINRVTTSSVWLGWQVTLDGALPRETLEALAAGARPWEPDER